MGTRRAIYNKRLLAEYMAHVMTCRNDAIAAFIRRLADIGLMAKRNTLSASDHAKAMSLGWPSHDQHLLAAALEGNESTVFVIEDALAVCAAGVKRRFDVSVCQL